MREIVRKLETVQTRLNRMVSYLEGKIEQGDVSDELLRTMASPTENLEQHIENMEENLSN